MQFIKYVILTIKKDKKEKFAIERNKEHGGNLEYSSYEELEKDSISKKVHPLDIKNSL